MCTKKSLLVLSSLALAAALLLASLTALAASPINSLATRASGVDLAGAGQWQPMGGPTAPGGQVNALVAQRAFSGTATLSDTLYALVGLAGSGNNTKVYKSTDGAGRWTPVFTATSDQLKAVDVAGQTVYVAGPCSGSRDCIRRSVDGGTSWTSVYTGVEQYDFSAVAINPVTTGTVYAAGRMNNNGWGGVVYATINGGLSWTQVLSVTDAGGNADFLTLAVNPVTPTIVFAAGKYKDNGVIYRSVDGGAHWTQVYTTTDIGAWMPVMQVHALLVHPLTPTIIYAGTGRGPNVVYRSADGGDTWNLVNERTHWAGFGLAFQAPDSVYAIHDGGEVYLSTVGGISGTWGSVGNIHDEDPALASGYSALYAGGRALGVVKGVDGGASWTPANTGIQSLVGPQNIAIDPHNPAKMLVGTDLNRGWVTTNGGVTWTQPTGSGWPDWNTSMRFAINPAASNIVYAGLGSCHQGNVLRSADGGASFTPVYTSAVITPPNCTGDEQINAVAIAPSMTSTVYAVGKDKWWGNGQYYAIVVRSLNDGMSWTEVLTLPLNSRVIVLAIDPQDAKVVYAGGEDCSGPCAGFVYRSVNDGNTWTKILTPTQTTRSIVIDPQKPNVLYAGDDGYHAYKSTDGGDTWSIVRRPPWEGGGPSGNLLAIDPQVPSHVYLGGWGYIAETVNGGSTWSEWNDPINQGAPGMDPNALTVDNRGLTQTLYAGFSGVWTFIRQAPRPGAAMTVTAQASVPSARAWATVTISSLAVDNLQNWVADGTVVTFTTSAVGSFASPTITKTTANGRASATLTGIMFGTAYLTVTSGAGASYLTVSFTPFKTYLPVVIR